MTLYKPGQKVLLHGRSQTIWQIIGRANQAPATPVYKVKLAGRHPDRAFVIVPQIQISHAL